jgi:hypothetical protein
MIILLPFATYPFLVLILNDVLICIGGKRLVLACWVTSTINTYREINDDRKKMRKKMNENRYLTSNDQNYKSTITFQRGKC